PLRSLLPRRRQPRRRPTTSDMRRSSRAFAHAAALNGVRLCGCAGCVFAAVTAGSVAAISQTTTQNLAEDTGAPDFFRPPPNMFQAMTEYKTAPGSTREVTTETFNLRYDHAFDLSSGWIVATRLDFPLLAKNPINAGNPNGDYLYGN